MHASCLTSVNPCESTHSLHDQGVGLRGQGAHIMYADCTQHHLGHFLLPVSPSSMYGSANLSSDVKLSCRALAMWGHGQQRCCMCAAAECCVFRTGTEPSTMTKAWIFAHLEGTWPQHPPLEAACFPSLEVCLFPCLSVASPTRWKLYTLCMYPQHLLACHVLAGFVTMIIVVLGDDAGFPFQGTILEHIVRMDWVSG